jgi:hypothetical protein
LEGDANAPTGWRAGAEDPPTDVPLGRLRSAFVSRAAIAPAPPPAEVAVRTETTPAEVAITVDIVPTEPLYSIAVILPASVVPRRSSHPRIVTRGRWRATLAAPAMTTNTVTLTFAAFSAPATQSIRVVATTAGLPGSTGWQRLPAWLPAKQVAWTARSVFVLAPDARQDVR